MLNSAGNKLKNNYGTIDDYILGDMTSTVYPVRGGLEDWAYGAGFDYATHATHLNCNPVTYELKHSQ